MRPRRRAVHPGSGCRETARLARRRAPRPAGAAPRGHPASAPRRTPCRSESAAIHQAYVESGAPGGERRDQTGGTAADDDHVGLPRRHHRSRSISEQKPGPMASSTPKVPAPADGPSRCLPAPSKPTPTTDCRCGRGCPKRAARRFALVREHPAWLRGREDRRCGSPSFRCRRASGHGFSGRRRRRGRDCAGLAPSTAATARS